MTVSIERRTSFEIPGAAATSIEPIFAINSADGAVMLFVTVTVGGGNAVWGGGIGCLVIVEGGSADWGWPVGCLDGDGMGLGLGLPVGGGVGCITSAAAESPIVSPAEGGNVIGPGVIFTVGFVVDNNLAGALLGSSDMPGLSVTMPFIVGSEVGGEIGCIVGFCVVGLLVGFGVAFGAGRHGVNAMHVIPSAPQIIARPSETVQRFKSAL